MHDLSVIGKIDYHFHRKRVRVLLFYHVVILLSYYGSRLVQVYFHLIL
jgi:hypothetical protein